MLFNPVSMIRSDPFIDTKRVFFDEAPDENGFPQSHLQGKPTYPPALPSERRLLVAMCPKIRVAAPFPRQKKNVRVRVRIHDD